MFVSVEGSSSGQLVFSDNVEDIRRGFHSDDKSIFIQSRRKTMAVVVWQIIINDKITVTSIGCRKAIAGRVVFKCGVV